MTEAEDNPYRSSALVSDNPPADDIDDSVFPIELQYTKRTEEPLPALAFELKTLLSHHFRNRFGFLTVSSLALKVAIFMSAFLLYLQYAHQFPLILAPIPLFFLFAKLIADVEEPRLDPIFVGPSGRFFIHKEFLEILFDAKMVRRSWNEAIGFVVDKDHLAIMFPNGGAYIYLPENCASLEDWSQLQDLFHARNSDWKNRSLAIDRIALLFLVPVGGVFLITVLVFVVRLLTKIWAY